MQVAREHIAALHELRERFGGEVLIRLREFGSVPEQRWFYEACFCLMTPQSSAKQCALVADELERRDFLGEGFDPAPLLRSFSEGYVRFHNTKAARLLALRGTFGAVELLLRDPADDREVRDRIATAISGLGMKEASHLLRNLGRTRLAIIDRHIIRALIGMELLDSWPKSIPAARYRAIEDVFFILAEAAGIPVGELDLLLWKRETGFILK